jgi:hypothetical protein
MLNKMAIVKINYTKSRGAAKATIRYLTHRPGRDGQKTVRAIYGIDGPLYKSDAYHMIDQARREVVFFRIVISPDPKSEDTNKDLYLSHLIEQTMLTLEERLKKHVPFIAVEHNDHTDNRHVHVLACVAGKLFPQDFTALRAAATEAALTQRRERDLLSERKLRQEEAQWAL